MTLATRLKFLSSIVYALEALDGHLRLSIVPAVERLAPAPACRGSLSAAEPGPCVLAQFLPQFIWRILTAGLTVDCTCTENQLANIPKQLQKIQEASLAQGQTSGVTARGIMFDSLSKLRLT